MKPFSISQTYLNSSNMRSVDINPLPKNYCTFDCVFCPLGRTKVKTDRSFSFEETKDFILKLKELIKKENVKYVFINPDGEALANDEISDIIKVLKDNEVVVKILGNGYLADREEYREVLNECDEVIGELAVTTEENFQRIQRPLPGYSLDEYISNMAAFSKHYPGRFILDITLLKDISDRVEDIEAFKRYIQVIDPDEVSLGTPRGKFKKALGVPKEKIEEIRKKLCI